MKQSEVADFLKRQKESVFAVFPTEHFQVTISARDGILAYQCTRDIKPGPPYNSIILEGDKAYEIDDDGTFLSVWNDGLAEGPVYHNQNVDRLAFCRLPGVAFTGIDLIQSPRFTGRTVNGHLRFTGSVPHINLIGDNPYNAGRINVEISQSCLHVDTITVGEQKAPVQRWKMEGFRLFQDHWIATRMRLSEYESVPLPTSPKSLEAITDFELVRADNTPLSQAAFDVNSYLSDGATVNDMSTGATIYFKYNRKAGDLKTQTELAGKQQHS